MSGTDNAAALEQAIADWNMHFRGRKCVERSDFEGTERNVA